MVLFVFGYVCELFLECEFVLKVDFNYIRAFSRVVKCCLNFEELEWVECYIEFILLFLVVDLVDLKDVLL